MLFIKGKRVCQFDKTAKPNWNEYYDLPKLDELTDDDKRAVGITDLKKVMWLTDDSINEIKLFRF